MSSWAARLSPHITLIACTNGTALGLPLVPEVKIIMNGSVPPTSLCGTSGGADATARA